MKTLVLDYWNRDWQTVRYNTERGVAHVQWLPSRSASASGWAYRLKNKWYALYKEDRSIFFQTGCDVWLMNSKLHLSNKLLQDQVSRRFRVEYSGNVVHGIEYKSLSQGLFTKFDAAYDLSDEYHDDFLLFVCDLPQNAEWQLAFLEGPCAIG